MTTAERLELLERYYKEALARADKKYWQALVTSCALLLILLPACFAMHLPWPAYLPVCGAISSVVLPLWNAYSSAARWAETCGQRIAMACPRARARILTFG